jgi:uncharacterized membrane protein
MNGKPWLRFALITTVFWGVWGAFSGVPAQNGFPETLTYCVWALTMIPPALYAMRKVNWKLEHDAKSIALGSLVGLLGAGGQMLLFKALQSGPPYLIFPLIALSPVVTIVMSLLLLKERVRLLGAVGIALALCALPLFDYSPGHGNATFAAAWFVYALIILASWGVQAFFMRFANRSMSAESIFFYMMLTGLLLIPFALQLTDFSQPINYGANGPWLSAAVQILNSIGALTLVYAFRYGRALVVSPLANAGAPLITAVISLIVLGVMPQPLKAAAIVLAFIAAALLAIEPDDTAATAA